VLALLLPLVVPLAGATQLPAQQPDAYALRHPVPIHSQADDPAGGAYGVWTAGNDWKASFDRGFTFYPWIPGALTTRGWQWRTTSVRLGTAELLREPGAVRRGDQRYEVVRDNLVEAYDVRSEGVEQSFRVLVRPAGEGELVIEGSIATPFTAAPVDARHGALTFAADGEPAMTYGAAFAFDAAGRRCDVATSFDGERVRLHVDAAFVASAEFPLTVDPLSSNAAVRTSTQPIADTTMCCASAQGIPRVYVAVVREFSASDFDVYGFISNDNPVSFLDVYTDITTSWSTTKVDLAEVAGAASWALAMERVFSGPSYGARVHVQGYAAALNSGTTLFVPLDSTAPCIGGMINTGTQALLLYGANGDCLQRIVDCATPSLGVATTHQAGATDWAVNSLSGPALYWCAVTRAGATPSLRVRQVSDTGALGTSWAVPNTTNASGPAIDGLGSRMLLTWGSSVGTPIALNRINAQRFDVLIGQAPVFQGVVSLASAPLLTSFSRRDMAYDWGTKSHWVVGYHSATALSSATTGRLLRLGHTGHVVENVDCNAVQGADTVLPCAAHSGVLATGSHFQAAYAVPGASTHSLVHRRFDYSPQAGVSFYGSSCANPTIGDGHPPYAGSEFYSMSVFTPLAGTIAIHAVGVSPVALPLDFIGMNGCSLLVDPIVTSAVITDAGGLGTVVYALPDNPLFLGDLYTQWFWFDLAANPFGLVSSQGAIAHVR
jgi:hypothetical protein